MRKRILLKDDDEEPVDEEKIAFNFHIMNNNSLNIGSSLYFTYFLRE